jgi:hypothetical protein
MRNHVRYFTTRTGQEANRIILPARFSRHSFMQHRAAGGTNRQEGMQNRFPARAHHGDRAKQEGPSSSTVARHKAFSRNDFLDPRQRRARRSCGDD